MALCVQNANADVKVVDVQFHCLSGNCVNWGSKYGFMGAVCPDGYAMTGCNIQISVPQNESMDTYEMVKPIYNSNTNPTQCGFGTLSPAWSGHPNITGKAICAKVCN